MSARRVTTVTVLDIHGGRRAVEFGLPAGNGALRPLRRRGHGPQETGEDGRAVLEIIYARSS